ncbi:MAG: 50S ribosomal protein L18a [Candidatus Heimdallarchaeota archaeon]|nr:50S ribosomal protein L18a [Candidatus Heimdallarchaeota archaeon]
MPKEVQVKNYRILLLKKPLTTQEKYEVDVRAVSEKDAVEQAYSRIGSKHRITRRLLKVEKIKEINDSELKNPILKEIASDENIKIHQ